MNLTHREARPYLDALLAELGELNPIEVVLIPPFTAIPALAEALTKSESVKLGAQNMHWAQTRSLYRRGERRHVARVGRELCRAGP